MDEEVPVIDLIDGIENGCLPPWVAVLVHDPGDGLHRLDIELCSANGSTRHHEVGRCRCWAALWLRLDRSGRHSQSQEAKQVELPPSRQVLPRVCAAKACS